MNNIENTKTVQAKISKRRARFDPIETINSYPQSITDPKILLELIFLFLRSYLGENAYRYVIGIICHHGCFSKKEICDMADVCYKTLNKGIKEYKSGISPDRNRQRKPGGGRKKATVNHPSLKSIINELIDTEIYGSCIGKAKIYTSMSLKKIQDALSKTGDGIVLATSTIRTVLKEMKISKKKNRKLFCGNQHSITESEKKIQNEHFKFIEEEMRAAQAEDDPALSIDCKKKEQLGNYAYNGACYTFHKLALKVMDHDFVKKLIISTLTDINDLLTRTEGKAIPFGVYDIFKNKGYVNVGITHDTPAFSTASIERFLPEILKGYPSAKKLVLFADGGGSNGSRSHQFKFEIAKLADRIKMPIEVIHYPPYKSKYNKIEHRLFSEISKSFNGLPLLNLKVLLERIRATVTKTGLSCKAELDVHYYTLKEKPSKEDEASIIIKYIGPTKGSNHWSYIIYGTTDKRGLEVKERPTVFDIRDMIINGEVSEDDIDENLGIKVKRKRGRPRIHFPA